MNAAEMVRVYSYIRASTDKQIASPETQRQIIDDYAKRLGRTVERYFVDPAVSGKKPLFDREAGKEMLAQLNKGDEVIVARLDRLSRSFVGFARILEFWLEAQDQNASLRHAGRRLRSRQPHERTPHRSPDHLRELRAAPDQRSHPRRAPGPQAARRKVYPLARVRLALGQRFRPRVKKLVNVKVADENERAMLRKVVELRAAGHSLDQIRQHLNYGMKVRTRLGGEWTTGRMAFLFQQGLRLMAETAAGTTTEPVASANDEEEYDGLTSLEDESND